MGFEDHVICNKNASILYLSQYVTKIITNIATKRC